MGLVLQAPTDALLPLADATSTNVTTGAPAETASVKDGIFASLLASLSATFDQDTTDMVVGPNGLPATEPPSEGEGEHKETDPFAALFAMAIPLPTLPPATPEPVAAKPAEGDSQAIATVASDLPAGTAAAPDAPPAEAARKDEPEVTVLPTEATSNAGSALAAATPESVTPAGTALEAAQTAASAPNEHTQSREAKMTDASPPGEASGAEPAAAATSVVRTVGNAEPHQGGQDAGKGQGESHGHKAETDRPLPKASESGIAHAAANSAVGELRTTKEAAPVDAAAAPDAAPGPAAEVPPQVEHVARTVIERVERGGGEARIHLDPAGMGEVTIHVHAQGDHVRVDVRAERQEAAQLLRDHSQDLSTLLGERGLNLSDVNVGFGRGNSDQSWGREETPQNRPANGEFAGILGVGDSSPLETHNRLRAAYNPDGALMYRV